MINSTSFQSPLRPSSAQNYTTKKPKKEKKILWTGIVLLVFVAIFAFITIGIPEIIGQVNQCEPFSEGGNYCRGTLGLVIIGVAGILFFGIPMTLIGATMILYSIFKRKNIERPLLIAVLCLIISIIIIFLSAAIVFMFLSSSV